MSFQLYYNLPSQRIVGRTYHGNFFNQIVFERTRSTRQFRTLQTVLMTGCTNSITSATWRLIYHTIAAQRCIGGLLRGGSGRGGCVW